MKIPRIVMPVLALLAALATASPARAQCDTWRDLQALTATGYAGEPTLYATDEVAGHLYAVDQCYCGWHGINMPSFYRWNGTGWNNISWFDEGGVANGMAVLDDGTGPKLYTWGPIATFPNIGSFLRLNGQWERATAISPPVPQAVTVYDDGTGIAFHASTANGVLRWGGTSWVNIGVTLPANAPGLAMLVHDDGTGPALYVAGGFTSIAGVAAEGLARWDGTSWSAVGAGLSSTSPTTTRASLLRTFQDETGYALYVGGRFTSAGGNPANGVARWNGTTWTGLGEGIPGIVQTVRGMERFDEGTGSGPRLVVSGTTNSPTATAFLLKLEASGWTALPPLTGGFAAAGGPLETFDFPGTPGLDLIASKTLGWDRRPIALEACDLTGSLSCFGDGSGVPCPCGNESTPGERAGCNHSLGHGGALRARGSASLAADTLALEGSAMPSSSVLYFQGASFVAQHAFGDGLKCTGGPFVRLSTKLNVNGASAYPAAGDAALSVKGHVNAPGMRHYQLRYRNSASFCMPETFNYTNATNILWVP